MIEEGYTKARSTRYISSRLSSQSSDHRAWQYPVFKIAMLDRWIVIVSGAEMNEGLQKLPDEQVSFDDAAAEVLPAVQSLAPPHRVSSQAGVPEDVDSARGVLAPDPRRRDQTVDAAQPRTALSRDSRRGRARVRRARPRYARCAPPQPLNCFPARSPLVPRRHAGCGRMAARRGAPHLHPGGGAGEQPPARWGATL